MSRTRTHRIWVNMKQRIHTYGWQPPICDKWQTFEGFLADMGECPSNKHTLDRIDNAKGYELSNCRWATMKAQQNNRTNNHLITYGGKTQTLMAWAEETGISRETIARRLGQLGWPVSDALTRKPSPLPRK